MTNTIGTNPYVRREVPNPKQVFEFLEYCESFYLIGYTGEHDAIYPFAHKDEIVEAVMAHITDPNPLFPFDGDSADREAVRDRICTYRAVVGAESDFDKAVAEVAKLKVM